MVEQTKSEQAKTTDTTKKWYVVRAISGQEKKVKQYIEVEINRLGLSSFVSQILIPTEKIYQIRNGKKVSKERPFYSGYILIEASLVGEVPHVIKNITGVIGFLGETKGGLPVPMRLAEVNRILGTVDVLEGSDAQLNIPFIVGETVKVINGPFNGFTGTIEKVNEEKKKLEVMVKIFGRKTPLELGYMEVEKEG
ncbi:MAG: transcription termination/antitermination protein NusG [Bacteroidia bacterium]|jgi:transcriptional antiterminator NusG|nr:transcription termination/antitermination protein NusG [Bacteroidia bacterium]